MNHFEWRINRIECRCTAHMKMVDLRGDFSNPEALIEALEEMEAVLTGSAGSKNDGSIKKAVEPDPN